MASQGHVLMSVPFSRQKMGLELPLDASIALIDVQKGLATLLQRSLEKKQLNR